MFGSRVCVWYWVYRCIGIGVVVIFWVRVQVEFTEQINASVRLSLRAR